MSHIDLVVWCFAECMSSLLSFFSSFFCFLLLFFACADFVVMVVCLLSGVVFRLLFFFYFAIWPTNDGAEIWDRYARPADTESGGIAK